MNGYIVNFANRILNKFSNYEEKSVSCKGFTIAGQTLHDKMRKIKANGFTLAEVLITLGIIGVIAAMTIPALITQYQKVVTVAKLKRAMAVLSQAYKMSYNDNGDANSKEAKALGGDKYFEIYWQPYIKTSEICHSYKECGYDSPQPYTHVNGQKSALNFYIKNWRIPIKTADGFVYIFFVTANDLDAKPWIAVDINGPGKPNKYGKDLFFFMRIADDEKGGLLMPAGWDGKAWNKGNYDSGCTPKGQGEFCALKIYNAGWKIDSTYPW